MHSCVYVELPENVINAKRLPASMYISYNQQTKLKNSTLLVYYKYTNVADENTWKLFFN